MTQRKGPNLQNIPIRTPGGRRVSDAFRPPRHGSAMGSMLEVLFQYQRWNTPPNLPPSPVMTAALRGLVVSGEPSYNEIEQRIMAHHGNELNELAKLIFEEPPDTTHAKARCKAAASVWFTSLYGGGKDAFREFIEADQRKAKR